MKPCMIFFLTIGVVPLLLFLVAFCVSPILLSVYKSRVTDLMNTRAGLVDNDYVEDASGVLANMNQSDASLTFGIGTKESLWVASERRQVQFDQHILQTIAVHLALLFIMIIAGNLHEIDESWLANFIGVLAYGVFLDFFSIPMLDFVIDRKAVVLVLCLISVPIVAVAAYFESLSDPEFLDLDTDEIVGLIFLIIFGAALYGGLVGRQLRNLVPYLTVAMSLSCLLIFALIQFYTLGTCILNSQTSDFEYLVIAVVTIGAGLCLTGRFIRWVAENYEYKRLSDIQIQMGCSYQTAKI